MPLHDCVQSLFKKTALLSMKYGLFNCLILIMVHYSPITGWYNPLSGQIILIPVLTIIEGILGDSLTFHHHLGSFSSPIGNNNQVPGFLHGLILTLSFTFSSTDCKIPWIRFTQSSAFQMTWRNNSLGEIFAG